jgi:hypothetical protein
MRTGVYSGPRADFAPLVVVCTCGYSGPRADFPVRGLQYVDGLQSAVLANCPRCSTTIATDLLTDTSECSACGRAVSGVYPDIKVCVPVTPPTSWQPAPKGGVKCFSCAHGVK